MCLGSGELLFCTLELAFRRVKRQVSLRFPLNLVAGAPPGRPPDSARARRAALERMGPDYRYHVNSIQIGGNAQGETGQAIAAAWNDKQVPQVPIAWRRE